MGIPFPVSLFPLHIFGDIKMNIQNKHMLKDIALYVDKLV